MLSNMKFLRKTYQISSNGLISALQSKLKIEPDNLFGPITFEALRNEIYRRLGSIEWLTSPAEDETVAVFIRLQKEFSDVYRDLAVFVTDSNMLITDASTLAGKHFALNPLTAFGVTGTAVVCQSATRWSHVLQTTFRFGFKSSTYVQIQPIPYFRDKTKDQFLDYDRNIEYRIAGLEIHHGGIENRIHKWSAGCLIMPYKSWQTGVNLGIFRKRASLILVDLNLS